MLRQSVFVIGILFLVYGCSSSINKIKPVEQVQQYLIQRSDSLNYFVDKLRQSVSANNIPAAREDFKMARYEYKKIEAVVEFYFPGVAKAINGPAIDKAEEYDDKVIESTGFQVIEEQLFSDEYVDTTELISEIDILRSMMVRLRKLIDSNTLSDANIMESMRLQIIRILSLGISGFDSPVSLQSLPEAIYSLQGMNAILSFYSGPENVNEFDTVKNNLEACFLYLKDNQTFDDFNRAEFITQHLNPLTESIQKYQQVLKIPINTWVSAVDMSKKNIFEAGAFDVSFFAPPNHQGEREKMIKLGKVLFFDPVLSGNANRSCASCHNPSEAFADQQSKSAAFDFRKVVLRNTPTLINSGFQKSQFWDQRVQFLEDQVTDVLSNPTEMHGNIHRAVEMLTTSTEYVTLFREAFGADDLTSISARNIQASLAWYIRSLQGMNSRFDMFMRGDDAKLSDAEIRGLNLFMGKGKCGTCHFMPLFNGSVPPSYGETEAEVLGVPNKPDTTHAMVDDDLGKFHTYNRTLHKNAFKTPTVRNAALTNPYMHNGVYQTLEEVLDFYNRGGGGGIGIDLPNQTIPFDKLNLSRDEQQDIVSFIHALTDTTGLTSIPKTLPHMHDPMLTARKVGGKY